MKKTINWCLWNPRNLKQLCFLLIKRPLLLSDSLSSLPSLFSVQPASRAQTPHTCSSFWSSKASGERTNSAVDLFGDEPTTSTLLSSRLFLKASRLDLVFLERFALKTSAFWSCLSEKHCGRTSPCDQPRKDILPFVPCPTYQTKPFNSHFARKGKYIEKPLTKQNIESFQKPHKNLNIFIYFPFGPSHSKTRHAFSVLDEVCWSLSASATLVPLLLLGFVF